MQDRAEHGIIEHPGESRPTDYLFRISIKCIVRDESGHVLVVKETGRDWWDLPGGGMDHNETIYDGIAREMHEEVSLKGHFDYRIVSVENPSLLTHGFYQIRLIFALTPAHMAFAPGVDADAVEFVDPSRFMQSDIPAERLIYQYSQLV